MRKLNECKFYLVSYPLGREEMKECMLACLAASMTSSMFTSLLLSPYWMFSAIVRSNRVGSWQTKCFPNLYALQYNKSKAVSFHYIQNIEGKFVELLEFPKTTFQIITKLDFRNLTICQLFLATAHCKNSWKVRSKFCKYYLKKAGQVLPKSYQLLTFYLSAILIFNNWTRSCLHIFLFKNHY